MNNTFETISSPTNMSAKNNATKCLFQDAVLFDLDNAFALYITSILTCVINGIFAISATVSNAVILTVITRTSALRTCSNLFLGNLVVADLLVGIITQPLYIIYKVGELRGSYSCAVHLLFSTSAWLCTGVSFLTLTSLNCERYVAIFLSLRYLSLINRRRVFFASAIIWMLSILVVSSRFVGLGNTTFHVISALIMVLSLGTLAYIAARIYRLVHHHHRKISQQQGGQGHESIAKQARETKLGQNTMWLAGIHFLCYLPTLCMIVVYISLGYGILTKTLYCWSDTILFLNSSLNPVIYCWRNRTIRKAVTKFVKMFWENIKPRVRLPSSRQPAANEE